jgi:IS605 OrfB family transposase
VLAVVGERVSRLWNAANYLSRKAYLEGRKVPSYEGLCKLLPAQYPQDYFALPSDVAQETLKKLREAWRSFSALRQRHAKGLLPKRPGLPRYRKFKDGSRPCDYIPVKSARSCSVAGGALSLTLPADLRTHGRLQLFIRGKVRYRGKQGRSELMLDAVSRCWRLSVSVEVPARVLQEQGRSAGIDLGLRVAAALAVEGQSRATLFSGREMLKDYAYWTRRIAEHQRRLSLRERKSSRRLQRLYRMRKARLEHALRATAKAVAGLCRSSGVRQVVIGWPKGIRDDVRVRKDWRGRLHNYWNFDRFATILQQALERQRIAVRRVNERGTSSTCPWTLDKAHVVVRGPRHKLSCRTCEKSMHSDAAGALNMLQLRIPGFDRDAVQATAVPTVHAWQLHAWRPRTISRGQQHRLAPQLARAA